MLKQANGSATPTSTQDEVMIKIGNNMIALGSLYYEPSLMIDILYSSRINEYWCWAEL